MPTIPGTQIHYEEGGPTREDREKARQLRVQNRIDAEIHAAGSELLLGEEEDISTELAMSDEALEAKRRREIFGPLDAEMQRVAALEAARKGR